MQLIWVYIMLVNLCNNVYVQYIYVCVWEQVVKNKALKIIKIYKMAAAKIPWIGMLTDEQSSVSFKF